MRVDDIRLEIEDGPILGAKELRYIESDYHIVYDKLEYATRREDVLVIAGTCVIRFAAQSMELVAVDMYSPRQSWRTDIDGCVTKTSGFGTVRLAEEFRQLDTHLHIDWDPYCVERQGGVDIILGSITSEAKLCEVATGMSVAHVGGWLRGLLVRW